MILGLDLGSSGVRSLERRSSSLRGRRSPACYIAIESGPSEKLLLKRAGIPFSSCDGSLVVFGENAIELSGALKTPLIPVFPEGCLPTQDPIGRQAAAAIIESVLPAETSKAGTATIILPGRDPGDSSAPAQLPGFLRQVLTLRNIACETLHAGVAVVLSELSDREFTGLGLSVGASTTSLAISRHGQSIIELQTARGMNGVDETFAKSRGRYLFDAAGNKYLDTRAVARWREVHAIDLSQPKTDDEDLLRSLIREWLQSVMTEFAAAIETSAIKRDARVAKVMAVSGGPARMTGFDLLVADSLRRSQMPIAVDEIRTGGVTDYGLARGCLIAAELKATGKVRAA
jgi:hypothetical protein